MERIFTKKYSGTIKRKVSEGVFTPSSLPELYIKTEVKDEIELDSNINAYHSKIYNIFHKGDKVEITSNTLAIKLTTIKNKSEVFYREILNYNLDKNLLTKYDIYSIDNKIYTNHQEDYIQVDQHIFQVVDVLSLDLWSRSDNITIRRLKDRFKITIKGIKSLDELHVALRFNSVLEPTIKEFNLYYHDCVLDSSKFLYTHSFEYYLKEEVHQYSSTTYKLRDIPISDISITRLNTNYVKIVYKTFRSNLFFSLHINDPCYIYYNYIEDLPELFRTSNYSEVVKGNLLLTYKPTSNISITRLEINPYMNTKRFNSRPEGITFIWDGNENTKYSRVQDISFGTRRVCLTLKNVMKKVLLSFKTKEGKEIKQQVVGGSSPYTITTEYLYNKSKLDKLLTIMHEVYK